jgi:hypothetical protein
MDIITANATSCYIIGALDRPETLSFATNLEYENYPPDTALNESYNIFYTKYGDAPHYIIEIPKRDMAFIANFILPYNLVLRNGLPFGNHGKFPLLCDDTQAWTLETQCSDFTSDQIAMLLLEERTKCQKLL